MLSLTEENYLKAIYHLSQAGSTSILTNEIAQQMSTTAASVTDMIKKLSSKKLIAYEKYHGVNLSSKGKTEALCIIRKHRLWETFLVQKLGFTWDEVHEVAEQLEHIQSPYLIERLDAFLDYPLVDPHGDPIPDGKGKIKALPQVALNRMKVKHEGVIASVKDSDSTLLKYLDKIGARPGKRVQVINKEEYDESMEILLEGSRVFVSKEVSENILVTEGDE